MVSVTELLQVASEMRIDLETWQVEIALDRETRRFCVNCGRKKGKTTASEFRTAVRLIDGEVPGDGLIGGIAITSEEFKAAKQILAGIKTILVAFGWRFTKEPSRMNAEKKIAFATTMEIKMPNGSRVMAFPAGVSGDNMRPYSFHEKHHDEADFQSQEVFRATDPCLARFNGVEILQSTPNPLGDRKTYFAQAYFGTRPGYKVYHLPSADKKGTVTSAHISQEWLDDYKRTHSAREYQCEILAEFVSDISSVFPNDLLNACFTDEIEWVGTAFIGAQYANFQTDTSVIAENFYHDGVSHIRIGLIPHFARRITEVENEIATMVTKDGIQRVVINTTLGTAPLQSMGELIGNEKVIGVANHDIVQELEGVRRKYMKEDLYVNALKLMERGKIQFNDRRILEAFMDVKHDYSKRSKQVYIVGNDITDAVVRALFPVWGRTEWLGDGKIPQIFIEKYK